jgi:putative ABC transport system permease protein
MALPISYNVRNVRSRWQVTLLSILGIALVIAVFAILMAMSAGFTYALRSTGQSDNAVIVQRGSGSELTSGVPNDQANLLAVDSRVARGSDGHPLASKEIVVVASKEKMDGQPTNVTIRGVTQKAFEVRGGIKVDQGRSFTPGLNEIIVGEKISGRVKGLTLGSTFKLSGKDWNVVGIFSSRGGAFESEIWGDFDVIGPAFQRQGGMNVLVVRLNNVSDLPALDSFIRTNPQMQLKAVGEKKYYDDQAGPVAVMIGRLATGVALIMGLGAVFGAMNTMYALVAARTREIGTLRALGFTRPSILTTFVLESVFIALVGGILGCLLALPMNGYASGTGQTASFSEIAFAFRITPGIVVACLVFAGVMGLVGGLLPAFRGARMPIISALREA